MHIPLPNGDKLVPDAEFLEAAGGVTSQHRFELGSGRLPAHVYRRA